MWRGRLPRTGAPIVVVGLMLVAVLGAPTFVAAAQSWTISISPSSVEAGVSTDLTVTIANTSGNNGGGESIGCVRIVIPSQFTVAGASVTSVSSGFSWSVSTSTGGSTLVEAVAASDGDRLRGDPDLDVLVLTLTVTGGPLGSYAWPADEYEKPDCSQDHQQTINVPMAVVNAVNEPPVAVDDSVSALHDRTLSVGSPGVLSNDSDGDADSLVATLDAGPTSGTLNLAADGSFTYAPDPGFVGSDSFTYRADDGTDPSNVATVTIDITDTAPVAVADAYAVDKNLALTVAAGAGVLANDSDADPGDSLVASVAAGPTNGTLNLASDGSFVYTPDPGYSGADSFTYTGSDGARIDTGSVSLTITNTGPTAVDDSYAGSKNLPLIVVPASGVLANDSDLNGDPLSASLATPAANGGVLMTPDGGFTYTPAIGFDGTDQFTYVVSDGSMTATAVVTIAIANLSPVASDDSQSLSHDRTFTAVAPGVLGNDTDGNGDSLTATLVNPPSIGTVTLYPDGGYEYVPAPGFVGSDSFTYQADDGASSSGPATVTLDVTNAPPATGGDAYAGQKATSLAVNAASGVLSNDSDADGDSLTATILSPPANGSLTLASSGAFTYVPAPGFVGADSFTYTASDGLATVSGSVSIDISNAVPVADNDAYQVFRNQILNVAPVGVLAGDTDADADPLTVQLLAGPTNGTLALAPDGGFSYIPNTGYAGPDAFLYRASDGTDTSAPATVQLDVKNRAPIALDNTARVAEGGSITTSAPGVLANDADPDGDPMIAVIGTSARHGSVVLQPTGAWTYAPEPGFAGSDWFTYVAFDGLSSSAPATVHLTVDAVAPSASPTLEPAATPTPMATSAPDPTPSPSASVSPTTTASGSAPPASSHPTSVPAASPGPSGTTTSTGEAFSVPDQGSAVSGADDLALTAAAMGGFGGILWAVPSLILSVPGLLLLLAILAQAAGGLAWLPLVRRKLGAFGVRSRAGALRGRSGA